MRPSLSTRVPVVLLVQRSGDDSLEMYTELLRYYGLAVLPVSDARHALLLAPRADIVVTGVNLDDPKAEARKGRITFRTGRKLGEAVEPVGNVIKK